MRKFSYSILALAIITLLVDTMLPYDLFAQIKTKPCKPTNIESLYFEYTGLGAVGICVQDNRVFISVHEGLRAYDISKPRRPFLLGTHPVRLVSDIKIRGDHAFLSQGKMQSDLGGLTVLDVSDPANMKVLGSVSLPHGCASVEIEGNFAYLGGFDAGLFVVDISDIHSPRLTKTISFPRYDNPNPLAKLLCSSAPQKRKEKFGCKLGRIWWNCIDNAYLYVNDENTGLHIFDISNPASPLKVAHFIHEYMESTTSLSKGAYNDIDIEGDVGYIALDNRGMAVVDVSNKLKPRLMTHFNPWANYNWVTSPGHMTKVIVRDKVVYLTAGEEGVYIIDAHNSNNLEVLTRYRPNKGVGASWGIVLKDNLAFITYIGVDPGNNFKRLKGGWEIIRICE